jgi:hypothetical protein
MSGRIVALAIVAACCSKPDPKPGTDTSGPPKASFTLFALAEVRGQIGPCGCTSDPLGDISRTTRLVDNARRQFPVLVVDAGSLLYSQSPVPPHLEQQEELKADLLRSIYQKDLEVGAIGLGPADLPKGSMAVRMPRQVVNTEDPTIPTEAPKIVQLGSAKVGVFGVVAKDAIPGLRISDPVPAGKKAVDDLKKRGAQVIVGLVQASTRRDAAQLAKDIGGIDFTIAGLGLNAPEPENVSIEPEKVGDGWMIVPVNRGQVLARIDVYMNGSGPLADAIGTGAATAKIATLDARIADVDSDLAKFAKDKDADPSFVAAKKQERDQLVAQREQLKSKPLQPPAKGSFFTLDQIKINKKLACSVPVQTEVSNYDKAAGEANVKANANKEPPPAPAGQASYVGEAQCVDCHTDEASFWKTTVHHDAWKTLEERGQQFDFSCIGCHVTGFDKPGGSNLSHNDKLRDVQCETCHGPGSIHVAKGGEEKPLAILKAPPKDLCGGCHTKEHSDTFQYEAYLRDILGKGHGEDARKKLGDGPTGHQLRSAALDKAGKTLGNGCTR